MKENIYRFFQYVFFELKTDTILGNVIAGLLIPAILFLIAATKSLVKRAEFLGSLKNIFTYSVKLYQVCIAILLLFLIKYLVFTPKPMSALSEHEKQHLHYVDSLSSKTKIGVYTFEEIQELLHNSDESYYGMSNFIDYRDSLNLKMGTKLKWHDSNNFEMEVFTPEFKSRLLSLNLIKFNNNSSYVLTEDGRLYFQTRDKIDAHNSQYYAARNKIVHDSLLKISGSKE